MLWPIFDLHWIGHFCLKLNDFHFDFLDMFIINCLFLLCSRYVIRLAFNWLDILIGKIYYVGKILYEYPNSNGLPCNDIFNRCSLSQFDHFDELVKPKTSSWIRKIDENVLYSTKNKPFSKRILGLTNTPMQNFRFRVYSPWCSENNEIRLNRKSVLSSKVNQLGYYKMKGNDLESYSRHYKFILSSI